MTDKHGVTEERLVQTVVSGGQTGVDRAALDAARALGLACGGWCPRGRRTEAGPLPKAYPLRETPSADYAQRTEWNVRDADATLVLTEGPTAGGTALTVRVARRLGRPLLVIDLAERPRPEVVRAWLREQGVHTLNVAGPRESQRPGIYEAARDFLAAALAP